MSQIQKLFDGSASGDVETLTGDVGGAVGVDAAFNINLLTGDGLTSTGNSVTNTITFTLDGLTQATATTVGAVTADIITIPLGAVATTYFVEAKIVGYNVSVPSGCGYNLLAAVRTNGIAAVFVNLQDKYNAEDGATFGADANFVISGNNLIVRVLGVVGLTINWKATTIAISV